MATGNASLNLAIRAVNEATKALNDVKSDLAGMEGATGDASDAMEKLQREVEELGDKVEANGRVLDRMGDQIDEIAEAGGNAEQALRGISDIATFMEEQLGVSLGPLKETTAALADLGGGIEAVLKGGPAFLAQLKALPGAIVPAITSAYSYATALYAQAAAFVVANAPIIIIIASIAALAAGVILVIKYWDEITAKVPILQTALDAVRGVVSDQLLPALQALWTFFNGQLLPLIKLAIDLYLLPLKLAFEAAMTVINSVVLPVLALLVTAFNDGVLPAIEAVESFISDDLIGTLSALWSKVSSVTSDVAGAFGTMKTTIGGYIDEIVGFVAGLPDRILALIETIKSAGNSMGTALKDGVVAGISGALDAAGDLTAAIVSAMKTMFNAAIGAINNAIPNSIDLKWNGIGITLPLPDNPIPTLARGGVVTGPTLAVIGDNPSGREAIVPLERAGELGFGGGVSITINALDAASFRDWLRRGGGEEIAGYLGRRRSLA